jgi:preprotein translocase subunit YajC
VPVPVPVLYAATKSGGGGGLTIWISLMLLIGVMYFLMIRPQQKRNRRMVEMQSAMGPGDEVVTIGGLYGTIQSVDDDTVMLEIAPDVVSRYARAAISRVVESAAESESEADVEDSTDDEIDDDTDDDEVTVDKTVKSD